MTKRKTDRLLTNLSGSNLISKQDREHRGNMKRESVHIVMTYPVHWSKYQVLRDFIQNFYDAVGFDEWRQRFMYEYYDSKLSMWVNDVTFNYEWLMHIGASTKTSHANGYAGFFGEGFKIASLCAYRDLGWKIQMMSADWHIEVDELQQYIDGTSVKMLAYNISSVKKFDGTKLILDNISGKDYELFQIVMDSFFSIDNPIMGEKLWQGAEGAVFLRSDKPINENLPLTRDFGKKGAVFCGYQMLGTNPFNLVVCLHKYRKEDRERKSLYTFNVIEVFEKICQYVDAKCAMVMLEKMRKYWNTYPRKLYDMRSWSNTINMLIRKISYSTEVKSNFISKYDNLLCLERIYSVSEKNKRTQALSWYKQQSKQYILVKDTFIMLGYPLLEEECEKNGGFVVDDNVNNLQKQCFIVLEEICTEIFKEFFQIEQFPERKIITNPQAVYHGMAVTFRKKQPTWNTKGIKIRNDIKKIYLKSEIFRKEGYYDGLSTYIHEMCHMFGGDASASFSKALTVSLELLMEKQDMVLKGKYMWEKNFITDNSHI